MSDHSKRPRHGHRNPDQAATDSSEKISGPSDRQMRFEKAALALAEARRRNRIEDDLPPSNGADLGCGCPIVVEGRRDREALEALGFTGPIELVNRGWNTGRLVAYLHDTYGTRNPVDGDAAIILLMDWDRTGGRLQRQLRERLESLDVRIDSETRRMLSIAMKPEGKTVEMLIAFSDKLRPLIDSTDSF
jgi:5S rRNA maturation endonuclease (ribonuclease M5)